MKTMTRTVLALSFVAAAGLASAEPITGIYYDAPGCDDNGFQNAVEEFGDATVFAPDETIDHVSTFTNQSACVVTDDQSIPNALVVITNLTGRFLDNLYYVGDEFTSFSNVDGFGEGGGSPGVRGLAFRIDSFGANRPLIFESLTPDGIFEPGETWQFIVQDYGNAAGIAPDSFFSIGMAGDSPDFGIIDSSASIVRMVPAPASSLLALSGLFALRRRR
ncbi:MAG TPA: hypothetical protein ENJ00_01700 [Phycisphaerales bacterium]|nr:hypothetical protein [Phycisphaerales bacterium]